MKSRIWVPCVMALSFALGMIVESARASLAGKDEPRVTGIGGIFLRAQNPGKLADWYRERLGISSESAGSGENAPRYHLFKWKDEDHTDRDGATVWSIFPGTTKYFGPGPAPFMIDYRVANLDRLLAQLRKEGVNVDAKIEDEANGRFGWATDPEGNRFELWEPN